MALQSSAVQAQWVGPTSNNLTTTNNVGIGTTTPIGPLDVNGPNASFVTRNISIPYGTVQSAIQIGLRGGTPLVNGGPSFLFFQDNSAGTKSYLGRLSAYWENPTAGPEAGGIAFNVRANTGDTTASTEAMRVTSAGKVGIGTNAPSTKLHVVGDGTIAGNLTVTGNIAAKYPGRS